MASQQVEALGEACVDAREGPGVSRDVDWLVRRCRRTVGLALGLGRGGGRGGELERQVSACELAAASTATTVKTFGNQGKTVAKA